LLECRTACHFLQPGKSWIGIHRIGHSGIKRIAAIEPKVVCRCGRPRPRFIEAS
jgi:hypothetical protein